MAEVKWIKIVTDIFDNRKIKQIEKMPDGDTILVIWFKLICLAGKTNDNGLIYITEEIPFSVETLSIEFNRPLSTVKLALATFSNFKMIEIIDDFIQLSSWQKFQNIDGLEKIREKNKIRQQRYRDKQKSIKAIDTSKESIDEKIDKINEEIKKQKDNLEDKNVTLSVTLHNNIDKNKNKNKIKNNDVYMEVVEEHKIFENYCKEFRNKWNTINEIPEITKIKQGTPRYDSFKELLSQYDFNTILNTLDIVKESDFLKGKVENTNFLITLEWFLKIDNFAKVKAGVYKNKVAKKEENIEKSNVLIDNRMTREERLAFVERKSKQKLPIKKRDED